MRGVNKMILIGTLGKDPEMRYTTAGKAVCSFSVATSEGWIDKATGEKKEQTEWHSVSAFDKTAELCGQYLTKGKNVYIEGKLKTEKYTDKAGVEKYTTKIVANEVQFLSPLAASDAPVAKGPAPRVATQFQKRGNAPAAARDDFDDAIPF